MPGTRFVSDKMIVSALYSLRVQIIRENLDGLDHVDALLWLRGADPAARRVPRKVVQKFRRGEARRLCLQALRDGPKRGCAIAEWIAAQRSDLAYSDIRKPVTASLHRMKAAGLVERRGRLWRRAA